MRSGPVKMGQEKVDRRSRFVPFMFIGLALDPLLCINDLHHFYCGRCCLFSCLLEVPPSVWDLCLHG